MYIHTHNLSGTQTSQMTSLIDELKKHIAENGKSDVEARLEEERQTLGRTLMILGEHHNAATRTIDLARRLMKSDLYRYIASETFLNAGVLRTEIRDFMRGVRKALGHLLCPYETLLHDLRRNPKYILFVGTRANNSDVRDRRIALHFLEEVADRKLSRVTPGVLICGMNHAARVASEGQFKTTRGWLEEAGFKTLSAMLATDDLDGGNLRRGIHVRTDTVWPIDETQTPSNAIQLLDLVTTTSDYTVVPTKNSPFEFVTNVWGGFSSVSIAERYEMVVLAKSMKRCKRE